MTTNCAIEVTAGKATEVVVDALLVAVGTTVHQTLLALGPGRTVAEAMTEGLSGLFVTRGFTGRAGQVAMIPGSPAIGARDVVFVGVGPVAEVGTETLRRASAVGVRAVQGGGSLAVGFPLVDGAAARAVVEGLRLGMYSFDRYRSASADARPRAVVLLCEPAIEAEVGASIAPADLVATAVNTTRDWVNTPPCDFRPHQFARVAEQQALAADLKVRIWDQAQLAHERCAGILAVGRAAKEPPRLVELWYTPRRAVSHLSLVGKGITFDSGGLTLKRGPEMAYMKCDMAGAAAVLNATTAIARLGLPVQISCFAAVAENMIGENALCPGDVITMRTGTTVEVSNTDCEGRLVLGDALSCAVDARPDCIIDVATLTGGCVKTLGKRTGAVLSNHDDLRTAISRIGADVGEPLWPLPITEEMHEELRRSDIADLLQYNPRPEGGTVYAAALLREFVAGLPWVHFDIAGPAFNTGSPFDYTPSGGTGFAVRSLIAIAEAAAAGTLLPAGA